MHWLHNNTDTDVIVVGRPEHLPLCNVFDLVRVLNHPQTVADLRWYCPSVHPKHPSMRKKPKKPAPGEVDDRAGVLGTRLTARGVYTAELCSHYNRHQLAIPPLIYVWVSENDEPVPMRYDREQPRGRRWSVTSAPRPGRWQCA